MDGIKNAKRDERVPLPFLELESGGLVALEGADGRNHDEIIFPQPKGAAAAWGMLAVPELSQM